MKQINVTISSILIISLPKILIYGTIFRFFKELIKRNSLECAGKRDKYPGRAANQLRRTTSCHNNEIGKIRKVTSRTSLNRRIQVLLKPSWSTSRYGKSRPNKMADECISLTSNNANPKKKCKNLEKKVKIKLLRKVLEQTEDLLLLV